MCKIACCVATVVVVTRQGYVPVGVGGAVLTSFVSLFFAGSFVVACVVLPEVQHSHSQVSADRDPFSW